MLRSACAALSFHCALLSLRSFGSVIAAQRLQHSAAFSALRLAFAALIRFSFYSAAFTAQRLQRSVYSAAFTAQCLQRSVFSAALSFRRAHSVQCLRRSVFSAALTAQR